MRMSSTMNVAQYYAGKNIFITGATGFIGKAIIEKLLRSCPRVGTIYMLIRPKYGNTAADRIKTFLDCPIFDNLRKNSPECFKKLTVVTGDTTVDGLGLSDFERNEVLNECNIIFHGAACVRFDLPLRSAVNQNTRTTKRVLELAVEMKNLEVFVHLSTSYCQHDKMILEEKLYPTRHSPQQIMDLVEWMNEDMIADIQPKIIYPHGNTYAYTKALSETLVAQYAGKFPIAVGRLSIVSASLKEPMPGWVENMNGPTGIIIAGGKGVLRTMICDGNILIDNMPLDLTVNGCILLACSTALEKAQDIRVCNITQSGVNAKSWNDCVKIGQKYVLNEYPYSPFLWIPGGIVQKSQVYHNIVAFFVHLIPAYFIDLLLYLLGKKVFMVKVYNRIKYGIGILQYYSTKEWKFSNDYFRSLKNRISKKDNETFYTDIELLDWDSYMRNYIVGTQKYILKEDPAHRPRTKRLVNVLIVVDKLLGVVGYGLLLYVVYNIVLFFYSK